MFLENRLVFLAETCCFPNPGGVLSQNKTAISTLTLWFYYSTWFENRLSSCSSPMLYILWFNALRKTIFLLIFFSRNSLFTFFLHPSFSFFSCLILCFFYSPVLIPSPSPLISRSLPSSHLPSISHSTHAAPLQVYICCFTGQIEDLSVHNFPPIHSVARRQTALITDVTNKLWGNASRSFT